MKRRAAKGQRKLHFDGDLSAHRPQVPKRRQGFMFPQVSPDKQHFDLGSRRSSQVRSGGVPLQSNQIVDKEKDIVVTRPVSSKSGRTPFSNPYKQGPRQQYKVINGRL